MKIEREKIEREIITEVYSEVGEAPEGWKYKVGDYIEASLQEGGYLRGKIIEITHSPDRGLAQLKLESGWCVHPEEYQYRDRGDIIIKHIKHNGKKGEGGN